MIKEHLRPEIRVNMPFLTSVHQEILENSENSNLIGLTIACICLSINTYLGNWKTGKLGNEMPLQ